MERGASKAQIKYARDISNKTGIPLPTENTYVAYWQYIAENKDLKRTEPEEDIAENFAFEKTDRSKAKLVLYLDKFPKDCGECPFWENSSYYDEDAFFGSGEVHYCPFGESLMVAW